MVLLDKKGQKKQSVLNWFLGKKPKALPKAKEAPAEKTLFQIEKLSEIIALPELKDVTTIDVKYPLIPPYAYAHIYWDATENELAYDLEEPVLNEEEKKILKVLEEGLKELINISFLNIKEPNKVIEYLEKNLQVLLAEYKISITKETFLKMMYYLYRDSVGLNEVEALMNDYFIEDIECNGSQTPIYIVHRKYRHIRTNIVFPDNRRLMSFVEKLAQKCGKYVSYASPLLDGSLPEGSRVNATYTTDITSRGPTFCFTEGYLQLNDGSVKKIDKFFEECKSMFGSKIEDGNEIVDIFNLNCVGVNENTLEQKDCVLKTVIKLKPPKKLVELELEDGSKISTTTNHLFHIADDSLKQIEAKNLKRGMFMPIPRQVAVIGCTQRINVHSLIQEFSYSNKVCIKSSHQIKELVGNEICMIREANGRYRNGAYREQLSQKYNVHQSYFYEIINRGSSISFEILNKLCNAQNYNISNINDVSIVVYGGGTKNKKKAVKIPYQIDKELGYLAGAIISDGHLSKAYLDISCYEQSSKEFIKACLTNKFGRFDSYYNDNRIYLCNLFVPYFFNKIFGIPLGKKHDIVKIPEVIFKSDNEIIASFIKGLFDGDGTCKANLSYKTNSKELAEGLTYLLARLGIYSYLRSSKTPYNRFEYKVNIPSPYQQTYLEKIGFENLEKLNHLKRLINKQIDHKTFIRHKRIPSKPVRKVIKKLNLSQNKLSRICKTSYGRFYYDSYSKSFVKNLLKEIKKEKNLNNVKEELDYIRWMLDSEQEFVRIKKVKVIENIEKKSVYDIELEPCKYFIAGNKPMNIFDTIRKFTKEPWTPVKLMDFGTVSPEVLAYLWLLIEYEANMMVIGGTGSGKTSFLNSIAFFIPPAARIVSIEDTKELNLLHENWLPSVARAGVGLASITGERHGEVSLFDLLRESFRQRPDYVIVGEIRGKEAFVLFQGAASIKGDEKVLILNDEHPKRIAIKDLKEDIKYKAISIDPNDGKVKVLPVRFKVKHAPRDVLYKITTEKGREVVVTSDHSVFGYKNKIIPFRVEELKEGDNIVVPARIPCGYADIDYINLIDELEDIRIYAPKLIRKAVKKLSYDKCCEICGVKAVSDYYANFTKNEASALKAKKFIELMKHAKINYNSDDLKVRLKYSKKRSPKLELNREFLKLLGYYLSEGSLNETGRNSKLLFYNKDKKVLDDIRKCIKKIIGREPRERIVGRGYGTCTELCFSSKILCEFIKKNFGKKDSKRVADFIFGLTKEKIGWFLSGLWDGDGEITKHRFGFYTSSRILADDIAQLLLVYKIVCKIRKRKREGRNKDDYELLFYNRKEKERFSKYIKPISKKTDLSKIRKIRSKEFINDVYVDKIKSISKIKLDKKEPVYDLSIPGTQNFIGGFGGLMLHNSGHPTMSTMHAESVDTMIKRLETPPISLSPALVESLNVVCVMIQTKVEGKPVRRLKEVVEVVSVPREGKATLNTPFVRDPAKDRFWYKADSKMLDKISREHGISKPELYREWQRRINLLMAIYRNKIFGFKEVHEIINKYYKNPREVLRRFGIR